MDGSSTVPPDTKGHAARAWMARARSSPAMARVPKPEEAVWEPECHSAAMLAEAVVQWAEGTIAK